VVKQDILEQFVETFNNDCAKIDHCLGKKLSKLHLCQQQMLQDWKSLEYDQMYVHYFRQHSCEGHWTLYHVWVIIL